MDYTGKTPGRKDSSQQGGQKGASIPPSAPPKDENRNIRAGAGKKPIAAHERERMIATAAYFRAQQRGFAPGHEEEDWLHAEAEVDRLLRNK